VFLVKFLARHIFCVLCVLLTNLLFWLAVYIWCWQSYQEAQLSLRDRAMHHVSWNLANCHRVVQKILVWQVLNKSKLWSWRVKVGRCVINVCTQLWCLRVAFIVYRCHKQTDDGRVVYITCKGKVSPYSLPSVGPGADPGVQAVSPQVTWSESRHRPGSRLPLLSARPAVTSVAFTRWLYL